MPDVPSTFVPDTPSTFVPDETPDLSQVDIPQVPASAIRRPPVRAELAQATPVDKEGAFSPFVPLGQDIQAQTLGGKLLAAPYNVGKGLLEGVESRGGLATLPLGGTGKLAQGVIGAGFGLPAVYQGAQRVYRGTALGEPQEALEGALQVLTGGLITVGAAHAALAPEVPRTFIPETEKPPIIPPPKISEVKPPEAPPTEPLNTKDGQLINAGYTPEEVGSMSDAVKDSTLKDIGFTDEQIKGFSKTPEQVPTAAVTEEESQVTLNPKDALQSVLSSLPENIKSDINIKGIKTIEFPAHLEGSGGSYRNGWVFLEEGEPVTKDTILHEVLHAYVLKHPELYDANDFQGMEKAVDKLHSQLKASPPSSAIPGESPTAPAVSTAEVPVAAGTVPATVEPTLSSITEQAGSAPTNVGPGLGGALPEEVQPTGTSLKNAVADMERVGLGLQEAPENVQRNMAAAWETSGRVEQAAPGSGKALADSLVANPERGLTDADSALLLRHKTDLMNRMNDAAERTHVGDQPARDAAQAQYNDLSTQFSNLLDAVNKRGSEWGREGRWRQAMAKEDFTFQSVEDMNRYRRTLTGEDLPGVQHEKATRISKDVKNATTEATNASNEVGKQLREEVKTHVKPPKVPTDAEKAALDAAWKRVRANAARIADVDVAERINKAKTEQEVYEIQRDAARKALAATDKTIRDNAKRIADAETQSRVAKAAKDRADAMADRRKFQIEQDKLNRQYRNEAVKFAQAERALRADPIRAVWTKVKEHIDKGDDDPANIVSKVATELGMSGDEVVRYMARSPKMKRLMDDAWYKAQKAAAMRQNAKMWVRTLDMPGYEKFLSNIPKVLFGLKVGFHGTVALGTHAPTVAFQPRFWSTYVRDFGKMYKMVGLPTREGQIAARTYFERQAQDLVRRKNYIPARRAGLVNDPKVFEDFSSPDTAKYFGNLTGMGNRGYTVLKILRQDMFDQMYDKLPRSLQVQDSVVKALADQINHATGVVTTRVPRLANLVAFAPRLEAARFMQVLGDPIRAGRALLNWKTATAGERLFAKEQFKEKLWILGTFFSALALNQGFLEANGSKQKINGLPKALGGRGFDPMESDFLKFKAAGHDIAYGSAIVNMMKLPIRGYAAVAYQGKGSHLVLEDERLGKVAQDYIRSQLSPFSGLLTDLAIGRDYARRPLPRAAFGLLPGRTDIPKRLRLHGVTTPYTWAEYSSQQFTPIPISEGIREVWKYGLGMSDKQIEQYAKAAAVIMSMAGTGARITEDRNIERDQ